MRTLQPKISKYTPKRHALNPRLQTDDSVIVAAPVTNKPKSERAKEFTARRVVISEDVQANPLLDDYLQSLFIDKEFLANLQDVSSKIYADVRDIITHTMAFNSVLSSLETSMQERIDEATQITSPTLVKHIEALSDNLLVVYFVNLLMAKCGVEDKELQRQLLQSILSAPATTPEADKKGKATDMSWLKMAFDQTQKRKADRERNDILSSVGRKDKSNRRSSFSLVRET